MYFLIFLLLIVELFFLVIYYLLSENRKKQSLRYDTLEKKYLSMVYENNLLRQGLETQMKRNRTLSLHLKLKFDTELAFLNYIKASKRKKNPNLELLLNELLLKTDSLIQIDKKNPEILNESYQENQKFKEKLTEIFPSLTDQELRLCIYFMLKLSSKEISLFENLTSGSIRVYKTKIKSKMGLQKDDSLHSFLIEFKTDNSGEEKLSFNIPESGVLKIS